MTTEIPPEIEPPKFVATPEYLALQSKTEANLKALLARRNAFYEEHKTPADEQDHQMVYRLDQEYNSIVNRIVEDERSHILDMVFSKPKIQRFISKKGSIFTEDNLRAVAECGELRDGTRISGLLAAIINSKEGYSYNEFSAYVGMRAEKAIYDHMRIVLGRNNKRNEEASASNNPNEINGSNKQNEPSPKERTKTEEKRRQARNNLRTAKSLQSLYENDQGKRDSDPEGLYFLCAQGEEVGILKALETLPEDQQQRLGALFDAINHAEDRAGKPQKTPQMKEDISALKRAWCKLDDDQLSPDLVELRYQLKEAHSPEKRGKIVKKLRNAFHVREKELGNWVGLSESRISQIESTFETSGAILAAFGVTERHLYPEAVIDYPECWSDRKIALEMEEVSDPKSKGELARCIYKIIIASLFRHPELVEGHIGQGGKDVQECLHSLELGILPDYSDPQLQKILTASGITWGMLPNRDLFKSAKAIPTSTAVPESSELPTKKIAPTYIAKDKKSDQSTFSREDANSLRYLKSLIARRIPLSNAEHEEFANLVRQQAESKKAR